VAAWRRRRRNGGIGIVSNMASAGAIGGGGDGVGGAAKINIANIAAGSIKRKA